MTSPLVITAGGAGAQGLQVSVDLRGVQNVLTGMPKAAYFWLRDFLGRSLIQHRKTWLSTKSTKFGRAKEGGRGIRVTTVNGGTGALADNEVRYSVEPQERRQPTAAAAAAALQKLGAAIETGNEVLPVHEFGTDIRSSKSMFIPVKTVPGDFEDWRAANPGKDLLFLPSKRDDKTLVYEITLRKLRRRKGAGDLPGPPPMSVKLRLRWVLAKFVDMKPTLNLYGSWDALQSERDQLFRQAADKMVRDLVRADARDFV